jgi:ABC-type transport system substrate-binding protein
MNQELYKRWKKNEEAPFTGWDFSYLENRCKEEEPPWDYEEIAKSLAKDAAAMLDMGTGGGEVLSTLGPPFPQITVATEGYAPNIDVARKRLEPLGIKVIAVDKSRSLPFPDEEFDMRSLI